MGVTPPRGPTGVPLPRRQLQIAQLAARGRTNRQIARELGLSYDTVKTYMARSFEATGTADRTHLVAVLMSAGQLEPLPVPEHWRRFSNTKAVTP